MSHSCRSFFHTFRVAAAEMIEIATGIVAVGTEVGVVDHLCTEVAMKTIGEVTTDTVEEVG